MIKGNVHLPYKKILGVNIIQLGLTPQHVRVSLYKYRLVLVTDQSESRMQCYVYRVNLEKAIRVYDDLVKEKMTLAIDEAKCALSHLYLKTGEWSKGQQYLHEAKGLLDRKKSEEEIMVCNYKLIIITASSYMQ